MVCSLDQMRDIEDLAIYCVIISLGLIKAIA
jgi:metal-sulfur cluster biosynthetic enzyme